MARRTAERYQAVILPLQVILHYYIVFDAHAEYDACTQYEVLGLILGGRRG